MISNVFIHRPRLASVVSIVITLAGFLALMNIPVAQYPQITPPVIRVSAFYPGANAEVLTKTVAAPLEKEINGVSDAMIFGEKEYSLRIWMDSRRMTAPGCGPGRAGRPVL